MQSENREYTLRVAMAQMTPKWLHREQTLAKVCDYVAEAARQECQLVAFGEALVPGYPFWLERTDGARFDSSLQKELFALYADQAVNIERGDLETLCELAREHKIAVYLGIVERPMDRGGHSLYCSLVYIDAEGKICSVHRKLVPTYDERLAWSPGDGHGLQVHPLGRFTVGGLNCWENWMPLTRSALYALGEDLHVAIWPGSVRNTNEITRFIAREARSYVVSVSGLMRADDMRPAFPGSNRCNKPNLPYGPMVARALQAPMATGSWNRSSATKGSRSPNWIIATFSKNARISMLPDIMVDRM